MAEKNPIVTIVMNDGDVMKLELYPEVAENTVNNFISLVNKGFYDGLTFHRIISGFMETEPAVPVTASPENSL